MRICLVRGKPVTKGVGSSRGDVCAPADMRPYHRFNSALSVAASIAGAGLVSLLTGDRASTAADSTGELGIAVGWAARLALRGASAGADLKSSAKSDTGELRLVPLGVASSALSFVGIS